MADKRKTWESRKGNYDTHFDKWDKKAKSLGFKDERDLWKRGYWAMPTKELAGRLGVTTVTVNRRMRLFYPDIPRRQWGAPTTHVYRPLGDPEPTTRPASIFHNPYPVGGLSTRLYLPRVVEL